MKILGYWHIYMINHWYSVVTDQMRILLTSGLYDACDEISIGCIGFPEEKALLEKLVVNLYPKLKIKYFSENPMEYEFPTLKLIEADITPHVGFYFHTKSITRPFETIINHWRMWLNESILNLWREHYERVCNGYDVSSVNEMKSPDHFSGNFWWFRRDYIYRLPKIDTLDKNNRFAAEQWICMCDSKNIYSEKFVEPGRDVFLIEYKK